MLPGPNPAGAPCTTLTHGAWSQPLGEVLGVGEAPGLVVAAPAGNAASTKAAPATATLPAAATVETVAAAGAAAATFSWVAVIGAGIGIGLVFFALYEILFPTPIAFAGLIEYPIRFDTNFDTFDNWGGQKGKWTDSLKIYAEMVKTTNQVAGTNNIPFSWDAAKERQLKEII